MSRMNNIKIDKQINGPVNDKISSISGQDHLSIYWLNYNRFDICEQQDLVYETKYLEHKLNELDK